MILTDSPGVCGEVQGLAEEVHLDRLARHGVAGEPVVGVVAGEPLSDRLAHAPQYGGARVVPQGMRETGGLLRFRALMGDDKERIPGRLARTLKMGLLGGRVSSSYVESC